MLQTTLFTHLQIDGVAPDIGLVAVLAVAWEDGPDTGAIYGFLMGLAVDLFLTTPARSLGARVRGHRLRRGGVPDRRRPHHARGSRRSSAGIGGLFGGLVFITAGAIVGQSGMLSFDSLRIVIIAAHLRRGDRPDRVPAGQAGGPARRHARDLADAVTSDRADLHGAEFHGPASRRRDWEAA